MSGRRNPPAADREALLAKAALKLLEKQEWGNITLASVARSARLPLSEVLARIPSKSALPGAVLRMLANETARRHRVGAESSDPRERLFDATMTLFDVHELYATALKNLYSALQHDPPTLLATRNDILHLAGELLALAEADVGLSPRVQAAIFAGVLVRAASAWRNDDQEIGKTMARLDGDLRRLERFLWPESGAAGVSPASPKARKSGRRDRPKKKKYND